MRLVKCLGVTRSLGTYTCRLYVPLRKDEKAAMFVETEMSTGARHCDLSTMPPAHATVPAKRSISAHRPCHCVRRESDAAGRHNCKGRALSSCGKVNPVCFARRLVDCFAKALVPEKLQCRNQWPLGSSSVACCVFVRPWSGKILNADQGIYMSKTIMWAKQLIIVRTGQLRESCLGESLSDVGKYAWFP